MGCREEGSRDGGGGDGSDGGVKMDRASWQEGSGESKLYQQLESPWNSTECPDCWKIVVCD